MWMTFFGDTAIYLILKQQAMALITDVQADQSVALFKFFEYLPFSSISSLIATLLVVMFFVTSSDSGSLVVDMLTSGKQKGTPVWQRVFWAVLQGVIAAVLLLAGGLAALQSATIASALPFTVIMLLMCWGLFVAMRLDVLKKASIQDARITPRAGMNTPRSWQERLHLIMHRPNSLAEVTTFMHDTVKPALLEVAAEFGHQSIEAHVVEKSPEHIWLQVGHQEETDFYYSIRVRQHQPPAFMTHAQQQALPAMYYRAEVHLQEGGQNYDIMDWTREDIIQDLIDQYERHLHFLNVVR
jgi:choline/glycine/proline betaine transport protein